MSMFLRGMFKVTKPRGFDLKPRYYDEDKERVDKLKARVKNDSPPIGNREAYREHLHENWQRRRLTNSRKSFSTLRILLIFAALLALVYYFILK